MIRRAGVCLFAILVLAASAAAQINVRGQILLPNGSPPADIIRFFLSSDDGRVNEYRFTDSNGRFILERLGGGTGYTITIETDGSTWDTTTYSFVPQYIASPRITLQPYTRRAPAPEKTVSASSGYRPNAKAADAYEAALKELKKQRYDTAEQLLHKAIEADPKYAPPMIDLGALLIQQRNYPEAEKFLRQAVDADAKSTLALLNLGVALNRQEKFADAIPVLREALRLEDGLTAARL
ncbi:MAG TPA: tetratricopeptide repeat protein, partial [Candidatus Acidoferrales bacterium]|nr:tetratricopeptide repeat protein [Candidatus Acidoferrales bacterium]